MLERFGVRADGPATDRRAVARAVAAAARQDGDAFARRLCGAYVVAQPRFRLGLIPRSLSSVVRPRDWERLVLRHYDQLPQWTERDFARWLNALVSERAGAEPRPYRPSPPAAGDDATAAVLAAISGDA